MVQFSAIGLYIKQHISYIMPESDQKYSIAKTDRESYLIILNIPPLIHSKFKTIWKLHPYLNNYANVKFGGGQWTGFFKKVWDSTGRVCYQWTTSSSLDSVHNIQDIPGVKNQCYV